MKITWIPIMLFFISLLLYNYIVSIKLRKYIDTHYPNQINVDWAYPVYGLKYIKSAYIDDKYVASLLSKAMILVWINWLSIPGILICFIIWGM